MTHDPWDQWEALSDGIDALLDLDDVAREARLCEMQATAPERATALRDWLRAIALSHGLLETLPAAAPTGTGPWRALARVGEGGMGEVWRGERADGAFERVVAIKVLRADRGASAASIGRERAVLARLRHPGIAQLLDGGMTPDGRPWLVTEWVEGLRLDDWLRQSPAQLRERVKVMRDLGEAVAYAHANLVVHRDIKPANVVVDTQGTPRLLDFGIARLLDDAEGSGAALDQAMTPAWAAPEQLSGGPVDVRTDVYALGALMYFVLARRAPRPTGGGSLQAAIDAACQHDPESPMKAAPHTGIDADLNAIALKALARNPESRYASADAFAADLGRWLDGATVDARRPGRLERLRRAILRHPLESALGTGLLLALVAGIGTTTWQAREAEQARQAAVAERDAALTEVDRGEYLVDTFARLFREGDADERLTAGEWLDRAAALGEEVGPKNAVAQARLLGRLAAIELDRGQHARAAVLLRRLLAAPEFALPTNDRAQAECRLASALAMTGDNAAAIAAREKGIAGAETLHGAERVTLVDCLVGRANAAIGQGVAAPEALAAVRRALDELDALSQTGDLRWRRAGVLYTLAALHDIAGEDSEAARRYAEVAAIDEALNNTASADHAALLTALAGSLQRAGDWEVADQRYAQGIAIYEKLGAANPNLVSDLANQAALRNLRGQSAAALSGADRALALASRIGGGHPVAVANAHFARGVALRELHHYEEAGAALETAAGRYRDSHPDPARVMRVAIAIALNELARGDPGTARERIVPVLVFAREGGREALLAEALQASARIGRAAGDPSARADAEEASALLRQRLSAGHPLRSAADALANELH